MCSLMNISFKFHQPLHRGSVLDHCKHGSYKLGNTVESRICFFSISLLSPRESHATHHVTLKNMQIYHSDGRFTSFQSNSTFITFSCTSSWLQIEPFRRTLKSGHVYIRHDMITKKMQVSMRNLRKETLSRYKLYRTHLCAKS